MTERVQGLYSILKQRAYRKERVTADRDITASLEGQSPVAKNAARLAAMLAEEEPILFPNERIGFTRYHTDFPRYLTENGYYSGWSFGNITPNYGRVIAQGFDAILADLASRRETASEEQREFIDALTVALQACLAIADRYRAAAEVSHPELFAVLGRIPRKGATTFLEACVFLKFITYTLRCNANIHITLGRFDQYMYPYYRHDRERGMTDEELLDILEEFFVSMNFDTDLYQGVQQGDNGLSMVLGGYDKDGNDTYNPLSDLCMKASLALNLIDPKINLRVSSKTPFERYRFGTEMTKQGMGFPQYSNDDVVVKALTSLGYDEEDALDYTVAACWEFIIPGKGADYPNLITMNFPKVVERAVEAHLTEVGSMEELLLFVREEMKKECDVLAADANEGIGHSVYSLPSVYLDLYIDGCYEACLGHEYHTAKYRNFGCHGTGISTAADALAAIDEVVFKEKSISAEDLLAALKRDFEGCEPLRHRLLACPKMGNNEESVDRLACELMAAFSEYMNGRPNAIGGVFRAGTGSAMEYLWSAAKVGATADGRHAKEPYGSSYSPSLVAQMNGPLSVLQSFTRFDLSRVCNGGPLTMEVHDTVFRNEDGIDKVAHLVQSYILLGGHQLQINAVNRERLLDAQKHPEDHPNLIVRVWGWSGYFNELAKEYQDHIIRRTEFLV